MEDSQIIALFWMRNEQAIRETEKKYGSTCRRIAMNILSCREDAEECVNDACLAVWNRIPPERPVSLMAYLGRIVRNLSISRFRSEHAQKRNRGMEILLSELEDCLPASGGVEEVMDRKVLGQIISRFLDGLPKEDRILFIRRYWYGDRVADLARQSGRSPNQMAQRMRKLRKLLRAALEQEGVFI